MLKLPSCILCSTICSLVLDMYYHLGYLLAMKIFVVGNIKNVGKVKLNMHYFAVKKVVVYFRDVIAQYCKSLLKLISFLFNLQSVEDMLDEHDDVLVESNNENVMESVNVVECEPSKGGDLNVHELGILFKDEKEMYEFHKKNMPMPLGFL